MAYSGRIRPWMVAVALAAIGAGGATTVYFAATAQHRIDRRDVRAWELQKLPAAQDATDLTARMDTMDRSGLESARTSLGFIRQSLLKGNIPDIVRPVTAKYVAAVDLALRALDRRGQADFSKVWERAKAAFTDARAAYDDLVCRSELRPC